MSGKIVLIDGHSILNRAFYGVPDLTNAEGLHTNAVYGFLNIMFKILEEEKPDYLAVAFDRKEPTFRHEMYAAYKGTRKPMPTELREQVPVMKELLTAMGICILEHAGWEADDILGSVANLSERNGLEVSLVSGDRDLLQIASAHIKIRLPKTKGGKTEIEDYYAKDVLAKYQVTPEQFIELKALMGDSSDNIPGVPKIGEKTATELMVTYGSIEGIYEHLEEISKKSVRETLAANRELADLSKKLATIKTDCELDFSYENSKAEGFYTKEAYALCKKLGFKNILSRFDAETIETTDDIKNSFIKITDKKEAESFLAEAKEEAGIFVLSDGKAQEDIIGLAVALPASGNNPLKVVFIPAGKEMESTWLAESLNALSKKISLSVCDIKHTYAYLDKTTTENYCDILIAAYLLNPLKNDYDTEAIAGEHLDLIVPGRTEVFGKNTFATGYLLNPDKVMEYACYGAYTALAAKTVLTDKLKEAGMYRLFTEVEMPLSLVLYDMERLGMLVRPEELREYGERLTGRITELEKAIHEAAGSDFNINSPKQLGEILFEKMQLPGGKKTKTGYSTAADVLEKLAPEHKIVADILEYRGLAKLKSTYAEGLAACIGEDGRIHSNFNQTITATGRISSTEPNLQNIPMRMELGRQIRKVFIPSEGYIFTDADYSQIELRVLAHMSGDEQLIEAYKSEQDIHRITAAKVFHTPFEEVTELQRRNAKAVNFGIVYGISSFGLSQDLSITKKEAAAYIDQYFETYPGIKNFLDNLVKDAKEKGYAVTLFGRRRPVPELSSNNFMQRSFGERIAMNSPIQGTAADIIKIAMINVFKALKEAGLKSRLILQVHDELLIETALGEEKAVAEILEKCMKEAADLSVELAIDMHTGSDWYEAK
ncbi:MAG: DNA polymerase I [Lachnospiraceae bacterium]|nr:DNA polymerase I [Lachnospiraceae bacterium]